MLKRFVLRTSRLFNMTQNKPVVEEITMVDTEPGKPATVRGRQLFEAMGSPRTIVAPMVDQSELAWRLLSRKYGAQLCYTPMMHARLFGENTKYRHDMFGDEDGNPSTDRPLVVQFCANDPDELLKAAQHVVGRCDAVDLNLGCPQGIAKRGHYGSFLMEDWDLIYKLINTLHKNLDVPVTAKIRIYEDRQKTLDYAKMVLSAGAQFLTVHGRTREMKGQKTGLADWQMIRFLRENLPEDTVMIANGNILYQEDNTRCMEVTGVDAVMSAEGNLYNPAVFNIGEKYGIDQKFPRVDKLIREYFELAKSTPGNASKSAMKSHFFKVLRPFLAKHINIRNQLGPLRKGDMDGYENIVRQVEKEVAAIYEKLENGDEDIPKDIIIENVDGSEYKEIPYWRCQPYFRVVDGVQSNGKRVSDLKPSSKEEAAASTTDQHVKKKVALEI